MMLLVIFLLVLNARGQVDVEVRAGEKLSAIDSILKLAASERRADLLVSLKRMQVLAEGRNWMAREAMFRYGDLCLRLHEHRQKNALKEASKAFGLLEKKTGIWSRRGSIGLLRILAAEGKQRKAIAKLELHLACWRPDEGSVEAARFLGCMLARKKASLPELKRSVKAYQHALKVFASLGSCQQPLVSREVLRQELAGVRRRIKELIDGRLKLAFEKAEFLRKRGKLSAAIAAYSAIQKDFPGERLASLSGLRKCQCLKSSGKIDQAVRVARLFVISDPLGPYRGGAHLLIGDVMLEEHFNVSNSQPEFSCILDPLKNSPSWVAQGRRGLKSSADARKLTSVPDKSRLEFHKEAHERLGIIQYVRGDLAGAGRHFLKSSQIDPELRYGREVLTGMALVSERCRLGLEIVPRRLLGGRNKRAVLALVIASIYYEGWKYVKARTLYQRISTGDLSKRISNDQKAFALLRVGACFSLESNDVKKAGKIYAGFRKTPLNKSCFAPQALNQWACLLMRTGSTKEAAKLFEDVYTRHAGSLEACDALFYRAFVAYATESKQQALAYYQFFLRRYPKAPGAPKARDMIGHLKWALEKERKSKFSMEKKK
jgi:tetratricopeptide (TPR) repeat protein